MEGPNSHERKRNSSTPRRLGKMVGAIVHDSIEGVVVSGEIMVTGEETPAAAKDQDHTISIDPEVIVPRAQQGLVIITSKVRSSGGLLCRAYTCISYCCVEGISFSSQYDRISIYNVPLACKRE